MTRLLPRLLRAGLVLFAATAALAAQAADSAPVTVFAAASLKESMDQAAALYQKTTGTPVTVSYAASSTLARQIEQGAPADVFVSADLEWMDYLQQRALIDPASRRNLLGNTLVLVAPKASTAQVRLTQPGALDKALGDGRLAVGQVNAVPAGKYAKAALTSLRLWDGVQGRLAESDSVRSALLLVSRGESPLGIVYGSDAAADANVRVVDTFPASSHPAIVYPVATLKAGTAPARAAFVQWLGTAPAQAIFRQHGFTVLP
ncbi:molybdate ABC transporter substrate-binding protein [Pseudoxanthomonas winnipegensis]|uniref:molybdate ABC transporter substrate-binding protein n=1 Tax=Pseudoxanthomonas winnipegensis TaxID=2480810 RepID=UPI00102D8204|nr:molybdate ABC transporter substrate-binding protein [Pseudoxanthomonas winnipegensis]TAA41354.1 molybdate ABC transporter substrate-binding protein [Pseudoxanthomonas winnipegensis]